MSAILAAHVIYSDVVSLGSTNSGVYNSTETLPAGFTVTGYEVEIISTFVSSSSPSASIFLGIGVPGWDSKDAFALVSDNQDKVLDEMIAPESDLIPTQLTVSAYTDTGNLNDIISGEAKIFLLGDITL